MASSRSSPMRSACWRKSGVVSITTFWPPREISREGRSLLSWGSLDLQTRQGHPSVGTPMEVPDPSTVIFNGAEGMLRANDTNRYVEPGKTARCLLRAGLSFGFGGLGRNRLINFEIGHLQFSQKVQQQGVLLRRKIAFGLFVQGIEHVDQLARGFGIDHGLASARVSVGAQHHSGVAAQHADEVLESGDALRSHRRRRSNRCFGRLGWRGGNLCCFALGFPFFFLDDFLAQLPFGRKRATVDNSKRFFLFVFGQGTFPSD